MLTTQHPLPKKVSTTLPATVVSQSVGIVGLQTKATVCFYGIAGIAQLAY
jgi:hypothetical protein